MSQDPVATTSLPPAKADSPLASGDRSTLLVVATGSAVTFLASFFAPPDGPRVGQADAAEGRAWVETNAGTLHLSATALVLDAVSLVVVAAALSALVRRHLRGSMLSELLVGATAVVAVLLVLDTAAQTMSLLLPGLVDTDLADVSDPVVVTWLAVGGFTHFLGDLQMAFVAVMLGAGSLAALRLRLVNRWLCYVGFGLAACAALGTLGITLSVDALYPLWFAGIFGLYLSLLVLAISATISRRRLGRRPDSPD